jgi:hypothetical protein
VKPVTEIGPVPASGWPKVRFRFLPGSSPAKIWPDSPISGPEALLRNIILAANHVIKKSRLLAIFMIP